MLIVFLFLGTHFLNHARKYVLPAGVAGGAASGKTTVCDLIIEQLRDQRVVLVNQVGFFGLEKSLLFILMNKFKLTAKSSLS